LKIRSITGDSRIAAMIFVCLWQFGRCGESISTIRLTTGLGKTPYSRPSPAAAADRACE